MLTINLLPWRKSQREQERKRFVAQILVSVLLSLVLLLAGYADTQHVLGVQARRNQLLQEELLYLQKPLRQLSQVLTIKKNLVAKILLVHHLQASKSMPLRVLYELSRLIPDGISISKLVVAPKTLTIWGEAQTSANISLFMSRFQGNAWLTHPELIEIVHTKDADTRFQLQLRLGASL